MYNLINKDNNTIILSGETIMSFVNSFRNFLINSIDTGALNIAILINEGLDKNSFGRNLTKEEYQTIINCMNEQNLKILN
jgi:hypothetical protein